MPTTNPLDEQIASLKIELELNEKPYEVISKHWGSVVVPITGLAVLAILAVIVAIVLLLSGGLLGGLTVTVLVLLSIWYVSLGIFGISEWYAYTQSAIIITNQRVIDCQQLNFFSRRLQTIDIYEIQSSTGETTPGLGTIFGFGDILINTIGDKSICINHMPTPEIVSNQIMHYHNLVAHGGVDAAHNPAANIPEEDKTPALAEIPDIAEQIAETEGGPAPSQPSEDKKPPSNAPGAPPSPVTVIDTKNQPTAPMTPAPKPATLEKNIAGVTLPETPPLPAEVLPSTELVILMFHAPSDKLGLVTDHLPAQKEPTVRYLEKSDCFEVEIIVPTAEVPKLAPILKAKGAEDLVVQPVLPVG